LKPAQWKTIEDILAAALELPADQQAAFVAKSCTDSPEIRKEVEDLLEAYQRAEKCMEPRAGKFHLPEGWDDSFLGTRIGTYKLVERIGDGGMGTVYRAERDDGQFKQVVAIKLVRRGFDDHELLRRLRSERQILALLEHPYIARLLDGGVSSSGRPYIVMEHIEGARITNYCKSNHLNIAQRLALFRQICSAVHYAHQRLVVHRDIKPSNILVAKDGTPKLLDFGIAKILDSSAAGLEGNTLTGLNPMTPEYASPEQIQGKALTTATDTYSLGVLLYELLTYQKPYKTAEKTPQEIARLVCESEPQKPSTAVAAAAKALNITGTSEPISSDLDHIVLKAMRKEPGERYASAEELSADVGNYLTGLPVRAREGSFRYLAGKFVARHKAVVALSIALLVALIAGLVLVSWQVHVARVERARAQRRFNDVRKLANSLIFEMHDGIRDLPGSTPVRKLVVSRAAEYLDSLANDAEGDDNLQMELAEAYLRLGEVQFLYGAASLGDSQGARASYTKAQKALQSVTAKDPSRTDARQDLARTHMRMADLYLNSQEFRQAEEEARQGATIDRSLMLEQPESERSLVAYAASLYELGNVLVNENPDSESAEAYQCYNDSLQISEKLLAKSPSDPANQYNAALAHKTLGSYEQSHHQYDAAIGHFQRALQLDRARSAAAPTNAKAKLDVSFDLSEIGSNFLERRNVPVAVENYRAALDIRRQLAAADPANMFLRGRVVYLALAIADIDLQMKKVQEAQTYYRDALNLVQSILQRDTNNKSDRHLLVQAYVGLARVEQRIGAARAGHGGQGCAYFLLAEAAARVPGSTAHPGSDAEEKLQQARKEFAGCK
jgi:non-specific serine/threonine protein kinase/serine/threonine-protein kinase